MSPYGKKQLAKVMEVNISWSSRVQQFGGLIALTRYLIWTPNREKELWSPNNEVLFEAFGKHGHNSEHNNRSIGSPFGHMHDWQCKQDPNTLPT